MARRQVLGCPDVMKNRTTNRSPSGKIVSFRQLRKAVRPDTATVISGSFDPFNPYYRKLLIWASAESRPLVVIVHTDRAVSIRRGLARPSENQRRRAEHVASQDGVDYVVISSKGAHHPYVLKSIRPKFLFFQKDNKGFLDAITKMISASFPKTRIRISPVRKEVSTPAGTPVFKSRRTRNPIVRRIMRLAQSSPSKIAKISAVLASNGRIVAEASNSAKGDHAETILLKTRVDKDLRAHSLYILIPPCPMCAHHIIRSKLKQVYYVFDYGDKLGARCLRDAGIPITKVRT